MQIVAKVVLVIFGIDAVVRLYRTLVLLGGELTILNYLLMFVLLTVFAGLLVYFLIFNSNRLAVKMAGIGEQLTQPELSKWIICSMRIGFIFYGFLLLCDSAGFIAKVLLVPFRIRMLFNEIVIYKSFPKMLELSIREWLVLIYDFIKTVLGIYLLFGAPGFVIWQLKRSIIYSERQCNE